MIKSQLNHQTIDTLLLNNIFQIFGKFYQQFIYVGNFFIIIILFIIVSHDFNETMAKMMDNNSTIVNIYKEIFESEILRETEEFYLHQTISYDEQNSLIKYLNEVSFV